MTAAIVLILMFAGMTVVWIVACHPVSHESVLATRLSRCDSQIVASGVIALTSLMPAIRHESINCAGSSLLLSELLGLESAVCLTLALTRLGRRKAIVQQRLATMLAVGIRRVVSCS